MSSRGKPRRPSCAAPEARARRRASVASGDEGTEATTPIGERAKPHGANKCDCCGDVSTHKQWHETVQGSGAVHAVGGQCEEWFAVWGDAFHWMAWDGFCAQVAQNEAFRGVVKLAKAARASGQPRYPQKAVQEESSRHLEIRQAAQILNEDELRKALGMKRLPT